MIILHGNLPSSLFKAAMLSKIYNCECFPLNKISNSLFAGDTVCTESYKAEEVIKEFENKHGKIKWLDSPDSRRLLSSVYYAARYNSNDRYQLIISVLKQALDYGAVFVLSKISKEARTMLNRARRVLSEIHRVYGFVRLQPTLSGTQEVMVGRIELEHEIYDIVLKYFTKRLNGVPVYLLEHDLAYFLHNNTVNVCPIKDLPFDLPCDNFNTLWNTYYDSQYIAQRKNLALARKNLPKKYWSWVEEGKKLQ